MSFERSLETSVAVRPIADFDNSYARLPARFFSAQSPAVVAGPRLIAFNRPLAEELGLDIGAIEALGAAEVFSGNVVSPGAEPIATAYAGHQFGQFTPQLGDGRAVLMGEVIGRDGTRRDIQWKGAGRTAFSRGGDGRAALGPVLREYLVSEAMHALGIPTTRALAAVTTGEIVYREQRLPGAVLTRVASSHIRVGTFQFFAARRDEEALKALADYVIDRHYPEAKFAERPYLALLEGVVQRQASLIAQWMGVGFVHGVMNTDNSAISGETIDFGPCAFMDAYDPATVFSSIDHAGRYAFGAQPRIAQWNLARLAETLLSLIDADSGRAVELATESINAFAIDYQRNWLGVMRAKLGLRTEAEGDLQLAHDWLDALHAGAVDFTLAFRRLGAAAEAPEDGAVRALFAEPARYDAWAARWRERLALSPGEASARRAAMDRVNPALIPRNHNVEAVIAAAVSEGDFGPFHKMMDVLATPYSATAEASAYAEPPAEDRTGYQTFCGT